MPSLSDHRRLADRLLNEFRLSKARAKEEKDELALAVTRRDNILSAQKILQSVAQTIQQEAHRRIADIVSKCLRAVFDDPYEFRIVFEQKRGKTEARLAFVRDDMEVDPLSAAGGGVVDVAAFALRVACLVLSRPPLRRLLVLDEPFRYVSENYQPRVGEMLQSLSKELGVQFIMVTHARALQSGTVIEL